MTIFIPNAQDSLTQTQQALQEIEEKERLEKLAFEADIQQKADECTQMLVLKVKAACLRGEDFLVYPLLRYTNPFNSPEGYYALREVQKRFEAAGYTFEHIQNGSARLNISWSTQS